MFDEPFKINAIVKTNYGYQIVVKVLEHFIAKFFEKKNVFVQICAHTNKHDLWFGAKKTC